MLTHEVCKECKLTKKAIEYYINQGLINPTVSENGYRNFSEGDIERLKKIAVLRGLGFAVSDIQVVLANQGDGALSKMSQKKNLEISSLQEKQALIEKLVRDNDWEDVSMRLEMLEKKQSILQRLLDKFPGYYGKYISLHFALYLNEPIVTDEQQEAFKTVVSFLDNMSFDIPTDLQDYLDEVTKNFDENFVANVHDNFEKAAQDAEKYISDNQEILEQYMAYKQSEEFKQSSAYKIQELFEKFNSESGYNDIFIPAMKKLSKSYQEFCEAMEQAGKVFIEKYPQPL